MNKSTNNYRRCAYCPHHGQEANCCCRKQKKAPKASKKPLRSKSHWIHNQSAIGNSHGSGQTIIYDDKSIPALLAENSYLKVANSDLRKDVLSMSKILQDENSMRISNVQQCQSIPTITTQSDIYQGSLADKLYISNKNLQESVLRIDSVSRNNKQLQSNILALQTQLENQRFQRSELQEDYAKLKKQLKNMKRQKTHLQCQQNDRSQNIQALQLIRQKYQTLKMKNADLIEQIDRIRTENTNLKMQIHRSQKNLSPEWITQTSNKISYIENKINNNSQYNQHTKRTPYPSIQKKKQLSYEQKLQQQTYFSMFNKIKEQLAFSINTIHAKTRKFSSSFDSIGNVQEKNASDLIKALIQGFMQSCMSFNYSLQKDINRKITSLEKRMQHVLGRLQNFVLQTKNRQLRKRSTSRSRISSISASKSINTLYTKSPNPNKSYILRDKQNNICSSNFSKAEQNY